MSDLFMVFDVESVGLHGDGFAVGWVVVNRGGETISSGLQSIPPQNAGGTDEGRQWVNENVPTLPQTGVWLADLYNQFWAIWRYWSDQGAVLVADCAWPVEARFLAACVDDEPEERAWQGPYPLHDLASIVLARGGDPIATHERLPDELPAHNPLNDARQSARLMIEALEGSGGP